MRPMKYQMLSLTQPTLTLKLHGVRVMIRRPRCNALCRREIWQTIEGFAIMVCSFNRSTETICDVRIKKQNVLQFCCGKEDMKLG